MRYGQSFSIVLVLAARHLVCEKVHLYHTECPSIRHLYRVQAALMRGPHWRGSPCLRTDGLLTCCNYCDRLFINPSRKEREEAYQHTGRGRRSTLPSKSHRATATFHRPVVRSRCHSRAEGRAKLKCNNPDTPFVTFDIRRTGAVSTLLP